MAFVSREQDHNQHGHVIPGATVFQRCVELWLVSRRTNLWSSGVSSRKPVAANQANMSLWKIGADDVSQETQQFKDKLASKGQDLDIEL